MDPILGAVFIMEPYSSMISIAVLRYHPVGESSWSILEDDSLYLCSDGVLQSLFVHSRVGLRGNVSLLRNSSCISHE